MNWVGFKQYLRLKIAWNNQKLCEQTLTNNVGN